MSTLNFDWIPRKPWSVTLACGLDYYRFFCEFKQRTQSCYLFESLEMPRHQDRYYSMGFNPVVIFTGRGSELEIVGEKLYVEHLLGQGGAVEAKKSADNKQISARIQDINPYSCLRDAVGDRFRAFATGHQGGLIGYFSHEAVNCMEPCLELEEDKDFALFKQGLYLDGLLFDSTTHELTYYSYESAEIRVQKTAVIKETILQLHSGESTESDIKTENLISQKVRQDHQHYDARLKPVSLDSVTFEGLSETKEEFVAAVEYTRQKIADGYSFQAEVGFKSRYLIKGDKFAVYDKLRQVNPSPYMFYVSFANDDKPLELMGASPEILLSQSQGMLLTTPTAGTIHRGHSPEQDATLGRQLLNDPKEIAEHNMLVDLHRNDLARVSVPGSVKVSDLMYLIKFSHVQHIVSNVISMKLPDKNGFDTLASLFPGGVVTGAPKIETIKIINENEHSPRGPYGGAVGRMSFNGDAVYCLAIRSLFCAGDQCFVQTSAGIVYDSQPEKEYQEVCNKLAAMKQVLEELGGAV